MEKEIIYKKAIQKWGAEAQVMMLFEEMAELQKAAVKAYRKGINPQTKANLEEELADVHIMLEQMEEVFNLSLCNINRIRGEKLLRLEKLVTSP